MVLHITFWTESLVLHPNDLLFIVMYLTNLIETLRRTGVCHVTSHDDSSVLVEDDDLHKHVTLHPLQQLLLQSLHHLVERVHGCVVKSDKSARGNNVQLHAGQVSNCPMTPGDGEEEVWFWLWRTLDNASIKQHQFISETICFLWNECEKCKEILNLSIFLFQIYFIFKRSNSIFFTQSIMFFWKSAFHISD